MFRKLEALTITIPEREHLKLFLHQRDVDESVPTSERAKARIMLELMDLVLEEAADQSGLVDVKLVGTRGDSKGDVS